MDVALEFSKQMDKRITDDCREYWDKHFSFLKDEIHEDDDGTFADKSGFIFPGLGRYREYIRFDVTETFEVNKERFNSTRCSPGILTVQFCCDKPHILGYIVMIRYLKGEKLIPLLKMIFALLNIATRYRRKYGVKALEDANLWD